MLTVLRPRPIGATNNCKLRVRRSKLRGEPDGQADEPKAARAALTFMPS